MKNSLIAIIGAVVVIGGGAFLLLGGDNNTPVTNQPVSLNTPNESRDEADGDAPESFTGNLTQLFALGRNITCTFSHQDEQANQTGTIYIAGDRMRGDFAMNFKQGGGAMEASTIQKNNTIYSWGSSPFGDFATKVAVQADTRSNKQDSIDLDEELDYQCQQWRVDNSKFDLPSNVNFDDINQEINQINESTQQLLDLQCSSCDSVPDPAARQQCLAALGC